MKNLNDPIKLDVRGLLKTIEEADLYEDVSWDEYQDMQNEITPHGPIVEQLPPKLVHTKESQ